MLEEVGYAAWPALEEERRNGWILRAAGGATRRANSASPLGRGAGSIDAQIHACEEWYSARRLPAIFRLTEAADPRVDQRLQDLGYGRDGGAVIMTRPAAGVTSPRVPVSMEDRPTPGWLARMAEEPGRGGELQLVLRDMLGRIEGPAGFAAVKEQKRTVAIGLGVVARDHLAIFMMQTVPDRRRQGLATAIVGGLAIWAARWSVEHLFLQVHPDNPGARAFYAGLGFRDRYEYWYRVGTVH